MAKQTETPAANKSTPDRKALAELVKQLQAIEDYAARKAFYEANPALRAVIDPCNFPD